MATPITHGTNNDRNIIVEAEYDKAGRMVALRDPNGHRTTFGYDQLNRRTSRTNPLGHSWQTAYAANGSGTQTVQTFPGVNGGSSYDVTRVTDGAGRLHSINYGDAVTTPDVTFEYDLAGNRTGMVENNGTSDIRKTTFGYDRARRLNQVAFDGDADGTPENTVSYEYDLGGNRTRMTVDGQTIEYQYDSKGQLVGMTDWDSQATGFTYDAVGRHTSTLRHNSLRSRYVYDAGGRLRRLYHGKRGESLADFRYEVDKRGNRTKATEVLLHPATTNDTIIVPPDEAITYHGIWSSNGSYIETTERGAWLSAAVYAKGDVTVTVASQGDFDIRLGNSLWRSFHATTETTITIPFKSAGYAEIELRNRSDALLQFKQIVIPDVSYDLHQIEYTYDALSRLLEADYNSGATVYGYGYDPAGNMVNMDGVTRTYNAANQMMHDGTNALTYDPNGNLTSDGVNTYTWDRANRMIGAPGSTTYAYDGLDNRIAQTVSSVVTEYLNDTQPGLTKVIAQTTGANTDHFVHGPRGIHAMENASGNWTYAAQDGLGSVRAEIDSMVDVQATQNLDPFLTPMNVTGTAEMPFGATGEQVDDNALLYLRARYMNPSIGGFLSLDPFEGLYERTMSLNGYLYAHGDPVNLTDPSGRQPAPPAIDWDEILRKIIRNANSTSIDWDAALREAIRRRGIVPTPQLIAQGLGRLAAAGILITTLIPDQRPNGLICNAWEYQLGLCDPFWDNPATYQGLGTQPQLGWQPVDLGDQCLAQPLPQTSVPPYRDPPRVDTRADTADTHCEPGAFIRWWNSKPLAGGVYNLRWYEYEQKVARDAPGAMGGERPRRIPAGVRNIDADGALSATCQLIEAKYGSPPPWADIPDEVRRYRAAITIPNGTPGAQPSGLIIRTNTDSLQEYFETIMQTEGFTIGVDGFVEMCTVDLQGVVTCQ